MSYLNFVRGLLCTLLISSATHAVNIDMVTVGNPGNAPDTTGFGAVNYFYRIGKYEVTNAQYVEFLNGVDSTGANTLALYNSSMSNDARGGINFNSGAANGSKYEIKAGRDNNPVVFVSWYDSIRFANWLHNGQGSGDTENGAYTLGTLGAGGVPTSGDTITRNAGATWWLPSANEWHKAAYHKNDGVTGNYWDYPTSTDAIPYSDQPPGSGAPDPSNTANFYKDDGSANGYNDGYAVTGSPSFPSGNALTDVGACTSALSPYGTLDQGGNVSEWYELLAGPFRGQRGGTWSNVSEYMQSLSVISARPTSGFATDGFRVASIVIPEPSTLLLLCFGSLTALWRRRTRVSPSRTEHRLQKLGSRHGDASEALPYPFDNFGSDFAEPSHDNRLGQGIDLIDTDRAWTIERARDQVGRSDAEAVGHRRGVRCHGHDDRVRAAAIVSIARDDDDRSPLMGRQVGKRDRNQDDVALLRHDSNPHHPRDYPRNRCCCRQPPTDHRAPCPRAQRHTPRPASRQATELAARSGRRAALQHGTEDGTASGTSLLALIVELTARPLTRLAILIQSINFAQQTIVLAVIAVMACLLIPSSNATADTFGSGANTFDIEFVTIGNPGNAADTTGNPNPAGSVPYMYRMGKFEISEQMIDKANAEGALGITKSIRGADKPATAVSWNEAARFVNWLNTSTGHTPAYKFAIQPREAGYDRNANIELWTPSDGGYNPNNLYRNSLARYFLPSVDEWYKAAYYDPVAGVYYDYPTGSDSEPTPVASGTAAGTQVYNQPLAQGPADITLAGGLSPYGTMGQGGNVYEWNETDVFPPNGPGSSFRVLRGGYWRAVTGGPSRIRFDDVPSIAYIYLGFRVASIPEPSTLLLGAMAGFGLLFPRRTQNH